MNENPCKHGHSPGAYCDTCHPPGPPQRQSGAESRVPLKFFFLMNYIGNVSPTDYFCSASPWAPHVFEYEGGLELTSDRLAILLSDYKLRKIEVREDNKVRFYFDD